METREVRTERRQQVHGTGRKMEDFLKEEAFDLDHECCIGF